MKKLLLVSALVMLAVGLSAQATIVLDDFMTNDPLGYWGLTCTTANVAVYGSETGLAGTIGGSRDVMFNANNAGSSWFSIGGGYADQSNSSNKYSLSEMTYNGGGGAGGLNLNLTSGTKFSVDYWIDHLGYQKQSVLRITLNDGLNTAVVSKIWSPPAPVVYINDEVTYDFAFSDFLSNNPLIDLSSIDSIKLYMETDMAGDYAMVTGFTTDAIPEPATIAILSLGGLLLRRKK